MKKLQKLSLQELTTSSLELTSQEANSIVAGSAMGLSSDGRSFIQGWEGYSNAVYDDNGTAPGGTLTVGWGHTCTASDLAMIGSGVVTAAQAQMFFNSDVQRAVNNVNSLVTTELSQEQFDALVSYVFNTGSLNASPQLLAALNSGDFETASCEMDINTQDGEYVQGLENRRSAERDLFSFGY